ncbi:SMI1/KNR4 family protein [Mucilaginibacter sp. RB4R14]|uniref:SMI1/KNR4 family protein n=1 Tax=Mucilaginibacter aurantiaciroseus TaxID=2949308 RepID=UPI0020903D1F|nr:SMI1/KNR4 family protein [Mucilaginibacter aurantiaciroseus]MCO5937364.1 SMI1/KNR4 family protein [Mucilaginibacter aurantiaciroseus]
MKEVLKKISISAIKLSKDTFTSDQVKTAWLGTNAVSTTDVNDAEIRLGVKLPEDYKEFLLTTNGFFTPTDTTESTFETIDKIDYLKNVDEYLIEIWSQDELAEVGRELSRSILIAGLNDEQYFLLVPPNADNLNWKYLKFANGIPGIHSYNDLESYFTSVLDLLKQLSNDSQ